MNPGADRRNPFRDHAAASSAGHLGMRVLILSLAMLFIAPIIGYWVIRLGPLPAIDGSAPAGEDLVPPLPMALWLSTAVILLSSLTIHRALLAARAGDGRALARGLITTTMLGVTFLAIQTLCWVQWSGPLAESLHAARKQFLLTAFYVLTGLHALHVLGGLVPLSFVTRRALAGVYTAERHAGVGYCATYWHFLDGVWIAMFLTLLIGSA